MSTQSAHSGEAPGNGLLLYAFTGLLTVGALLAVAFSDDRLFRFHGWIFLVAFVAALGAMTVGLSSGRFQSPQTEYADGVVRAGVIATMFWAIVGLSAGVFIAAQLSWPD